ncbi:MAG: M43 family zinc metalloprotease [Bacteroidota bacterium]
MNKVQVILPLFILLNISLFSQELHQHHDDYEFVDPGHLICGKNHFTQRLWQLHPEEKLLAEESAKKLESETKEYTETKGTDDDILIIPVVFHVVHIGGEENISDEQIYSAIDVLNEDFNAANSDIGLVVEEFADIVGNAEMEFRLAKIDPDGNCTNGINRVFSEFTNEGFQQMKDAAQIWDRSSYLNIWTCRQIGDGIAGYTFLPPTVNGSFGLSYDGIVILHDYVGRIGTSNATRSHALSHEVGHWANLEHTWGTNPTPELPGNCNDDDGVADTPNTIGWANVCDLDGATCGSLDNVENFMDYSYCYKMFTQGQRTRMRAAMNSSVAQRNQLYSSQNLTETGVLEEDEICFADFTTDRDPKICAGQEITFDDISFNGVEEWSWEFEGGTPASSNEESPTVSYGNSGDFDVTLTVTNSQGELTVTKENFIRVIEGAQYQLPYEEGFENFVEVEDGDEWVDVNQDDSNISWRITDNVSYDGDQSVFVRGRNNDDFQLEILESPTYDLSNIEDPVLSFYYAHARRNSTSDDLFRVRISKDCGEVWNVRLNRDIEDLPTVSGDVSGQFVPQSQDDWEEVVIDNISSSFWNDQFRIRFEFTSVNGNNIFVDNINIFGTNTLSTKEIPSLKHLSIYPNPASQRLSLNIDLMNSQIVRIDLLDAYGRIVQSPFSGMMPSGNQNLDIELNNSLAVGMYFIRLTADDGSSTRKLIIE